jgi:hypothetical protein
MHIMHNGPLMVFKDNSMCTEFFSKCLCQTPGVHILTLWLFSISLGFIAN